MNLNQEQQEMLNGSWGRGRQKAMETLIQLAEAQGATELVKISYAHLMPPDVMFFPYGRQGSWAHDLTDELLKDVDHLRVPTTIEPKFCNLDVAKTLQFPDDTTNEIRCILGRATDYYEKIGVIPTYSALSFYVRPGVFGEHVSIAESFLILWYNSIYGARCGRDDGVTSLAAAITGYCPLTGAHLQENRYAEVVIRLGEDLDFAKFDDADWDAFSLAASRLCKEKVPVFVGMPKNIGTTELMHILAVLAVKSGLAIMHIEGVTPEAPTVEKALGGKKPLAEYTIHKKELTEAYGLANTATGDEVDFVFMGCPQLSMKEIRAIAEALDGKKINSKVKLVGVTTRMLYQQAKDMGYIDTILRSGAEMTYDMCISFAGTQVKGTIATNSVKADFFFAGFSAAEGKRKVRFGSIEDCVRSALTGRWEGKK